MNRPRRSSKSGLYLKVAKLALDVEAVLLYPHLHKRKKHRNSRMNQFCNLIPLYIEILITELSKSLEKTEQNSFQLFCSIKKDC